MTSPTEKWLEAARAMYPGFEALPDAGGVAERLLLLLHYGIDWQHGWVAQRRQVYWERLLPDRAMAATFMCPNLRRWWREMAEDLESSPCSRAQRVELEGLLAVDSEPVLDVLRHETPALLLRTRMTADAVRESREAVRARDCAV